MTRPLLVWDGDCGFCRRSVEHLRARAGGLLADEPFQTAHLRFPEIPREAFAAAVHLVEPDGRTSRGAEAVYRALEVTGPRLPRLAYQWLPGFAALSEWGYRLVATHRPQADRILTSLVGDLVGPPRFRLTRFVFLRLLAFVYLVAFLSLGVQVHGLIGEHGLLPAGDLLAFAREARGDEAFWLLPTLGWLGAGDTALSLMCYGGATAALLAFLGLSPGPLFALCYVLYLSLVHLGQAFLSFQWDVLLTETGFLALLLAPWGHFWPRRPAQEPPPPTVATWLLRLLLFKLMFSSGLTKLAWGDPTWRELSALDYHYWTQPLPTPVAWYASHLPSVVQRLSCALMFLVELLLPFLVFAPRRPRRIALVGFVLLQMLIAATGNYGFFNLLALVLCVPLLDDAAWPAFLRSRLLGEDPPVRARALRLRGLLVTPVAAILALLSVPPLLDTFNSRRLGRLTPGPVRRLSAAASPLLVSNSYGLFRTLTTTRPEIGIEGSRDGADWQPCAFRYKPGDPARAPRFVAPHMPRLDWQMWFAALRAERLVGHPAAIRTWLESQDVWLGRLVVAMLRGEPVVERLMGRSPFGDTPPSFVRLVLWQYRFTADGPDWWQRERVGVLLGPLGFETPPDETGPPHAPQVDDAPPAGADDSVRCGGVPPGAVEPGRERELLDRVNAQRIQRGLAPLRASTGLADAARLHARDMAEHDYLDHDTLDRRGGQLVRRCGWAERVQSVAGDRRSFGENLAAGTAAPLEVVEGWMDSPVHRDNVLGETFVELGVGYWPGDSSRGYWVADFGGGSDTESGGR